MSHSPESRSDALAIDRLARPADDRSHSSF